jgi:hypothetical protein
MGVMEEMISHSSTGSFPMLACFLLESSNLFNIRPFIITFT